MIWVKKGLIIQPDKKKWWMNSHAMLPTPQHIKGNFYKIYYSGRDKYGVSHVGFSNVEIEGENIFELSKSTEPILFPGERGCFDDNGVTPSCIIDNKLFFIGWNSGTTTYRMSLIMGLAIENHEGKFIRHSRAPLIQRTDREPFGISTAPFVIKSEKGFQMWYVSGEGWINKDLPKYNIKYAYSDDGILWKNEGVVSLELIEKETALARPCVIKNENYYEMYFSFKDPALGYRIGHAISKDGINFERDKNQINYLSVSDDGWDSEMVEYSFVFKHKGVEFMLYNGNNYGKNGIGYAVKK